MAEVGPQLPIESAQPNELQLIPQYKRIAETLGNFTRNIISTTANHRQDFLEKTWYTHNVTTFILETAILKIISLANPNVKKLATVFGGMAIATMVENYKNAGYVHVGEHMTIDIEQFRDFHTKKFPDGTILKPGQKFGKIDFVYRIPKLRPNDSLIGFTRSLFRSGEQSLKELADLCEKNDPRLQGVDVFMGTSHIAGLLAKRLGFDVFDITNPFKKLGYSIIAKVIVHGTVKHNKEWESFKKNFKSPREAAISRNKLIQLFGSKANDVTNTTPDNAVAPLRVLSARIQS
jgi:hypothetical protein